jgi:magnesium transporter
LIRPHLVPYYRDVYDALFHISELAQNYTDSLTGILQVYLNMSSNQTGEVIKVLTLFTIITTPMMLIGTWYGMNFESMPEIKWPHAYAWASLVTVLSTGGAFLYFKKRKWF